jgi:hypothetical protein
LNWVHVCPCVARLGPTGVEKLTCTFKKLLLCGNETLNYLFTLSLLHGFTSLKGRQERYFW